MSVSTAVDISAVARTVGIKTNFQDLRQGNIQFLPQRIAILGQGASTATYSSTKRQITTESEAGQIYGFGSPIHLVAKQLLPVNGDGVGTIPVTVYPLEDAVSGVAATGDITPVGSPTGTASYIVRVNNIDSQAFTVVSGDTVAGIVAKITTAINAILDMPIVATNNTTDVTITAKWQGASGNDLHVEIVGASSVGVTFAISQLSGGDVNPDVDPALLQMGEVWETFVLNCLNIDDTVTLDKFQAFGEGRWGALTRKPFVVFTGTNEASVTNAIAIPDARKTDRINAQLVAPASKNLPFVIASRQLSRIAVIANNKPARDYGSQDARGLVAGEDLSQWNYQQRDQAVKGGSSTIKVKDNVINISDVVTFYHPTGEAVPAYRYVVDIVKIMNVIHNLNLIFDTPEWDGSPLIPDDQPTANRDAKKPKTAVAAIAGMIDSLATNALISDPETAKKKTLAVISDQNPKRLDVSLTVQLSGNTNIISIDLNFGFYFGNLPVIG